METVEEKPLREEILKVEVNLRHVKDPDKFLQQLRQTINQSDVEEWSLELIPIFFPKKKWHVPESIFLCLSVPKETCVKLKQWDRDKDNLIIDAGDGELLILNETKLDQWRLEKNTKEKQTDKREK